MTNEQKSILNWTYFIWNFPQNWQLKCFEGDNHIITKYKTTMANEKRTSAENILTFFSYLDQSNQLKMINWVQENYLAFDNLKIK